MIFDRFLIISELKFLQRKLLSEAEFKKLQSRDNQKDTKSIPLKGGTSAIKRGLAIRDLAALSNSYQVWGNYEK